MTCTETLSRRATVAAPSARNRLPLGLSSVVEAVRTWQKRRHDRYLLRDMPEYLLRDVGLDTETARFEADKPFWRS